MMLRKLLGLMIVATSCMAQNTRVDFSATTVRASGGSQLPVMALPGAQIRFYTCSGAAASSCTTLANTYPNATSTTACPTSAQVVRQVPVVACIATADAQGNFGTWLPPLQPYGYAYTITTAGLTFGPYQFSVGGGGGSNGFIAAAGVNGIAAALQTCVTGQPCGVQAPIGYAQGDTTIPTGDGQILWNVSDGASVFTFNNPYSSPGGVGQPFNSYNCNKQKILFGRNDSSTYNSPCGVYSLVDSTPGVTYGYGSDAPGNGQGWTISQVVNFFGQFNGGGLHGGFGSHIYSASPTDVNNYHYMTVSGNSKDGSAEGANVLALTLAEDYLQYAGTVTSLTDQQHVFLNPTVNATQFGTGRFLMPAAPAYTGYATGISLNSIDGGRITVLTDANANFPVNTFSGILTTNVTVDNTLGFGAAGGPGGAFQKCTYITANAGYTGSLIAGKLVAFDSANHDVGKILGPHCATWVNTQQYGYGEGTYWAGQDWVMLNKVNNVGLVPGVDPNWAANVVPTGGTSAAAMLGQSHRFGTVFESGGVIGGIDFVANEQNPSGTQPLIHPSDVIGSPDNHTLHLVRFLTGNSNQGFKLGAVDLGQHPLQGLATTAGVATMVYYESGLGQFERAPIITITGAIPTSLNGQYALPTNNVGPLGFGATFSATKCTSGTGINGVVCVQDTASSVGLTGGSPIATLGTTGFGNGDYRVRDNPIVWDVNDYRVTGKITALGTAAVIEPHSTTYTTGMALIEPHTDTQRVDPVKLAYGTWNPANSTDAGLQIALTGAGSATRTGLGFPQAAIQVGQGPDPLTLTGGGGGKNGTAPNVINSLSPTTGALIFQRYPPWGGAYVYDQSSDGTLPDTTINPFASNALAGVRMHDGTSATTICNLFRWVYKTGVVTTGDGCPALRFTAPTTFTQSIYAPGLVGANIIIRDNAPNAQCSFCVFTNPTLGYQNGMGGTYSSLNFVSNDGGSNDLVQFFLGVSPNSSTVPTNATYKFAPTGMTAPGYSTTGTTPGQMSLAAGTGSIPVLPANSAGFAAPATGGTAYLLKLPATITAGALTVAAPATGDGVNESVITVVNGYTGSCASGTTLTVVKGIITGCS